MSIEFVCRSESQPCVKLGVVSPMGFGSRLDLVRREKGEGSNNDRRGTIPLNHKYSKLTCATKIIFLRCEERKLNME